MAVNIRAQTSPLVYSPCQRARSRKTGANEIGSHLKCGVNHGRATVVCDIRTHVGPVETNKADDGGDDTPKPTSCTLVQDRTIGDISR